MLPPVRLYPILKRLSARPNPSQYYAPNFLRPVLFAAWLLAVICVPSSAATNNDIVVTGPDAGTTPQVKSFDSEDGTNSQSIVAYTPSFTGGVRVAAGDVSGDGTPDIITGTGPGVTGHVKVFDGQTGAEIRSFFAYGAGFTGGVFVAAGDVSGDGKDDIITGTDSGTTGGHVKVFDGVTGAELASFFAFPGFTGGVRVGAGDISGDGRDDIITGAGPGAPGGHVKVFDAVTLSEIRSFFAYSGFTGGVFVAAGDVSGDGTDDIITGADSGAAGGHVKVFDGVTGAEIRSFLAYNTGFTGGVRVGATNANNDGRDDIITGAGAGAPGGHVKVFDGLTGTELHDFFAYGTSFTGGVFVGGSLMPRADLSVEKTASRDPAVVGVIFTYTVTVKNNSDDDATNVVLTDTLPAAVSFVSATPSQGTCAAARGVVTCDLGRIEGDGEATVEIKVKPRTAGRATNTATVTSDNDPDDRNNTGTVDVEVVANANLSLTKTDTPDPVVQGSQVTYTLTVTNHGPSQATNVTLTDTLPGGMSFVSATPPCTESKGIVTCLLGTLAKGASVNIQIEVEARTAGTFKNIAQVSADQGDSNPDDNTAGHSTRVIGLTRLLLSQTTVAGGVEHPTGRVYLTSPAPAGGLTIDLSSTNPAASVPATVAVKGGSMVSDEFTVTTSPVDVKTTGVIRGTLGTSTVGRTLTVIRPRR